MSTTITIRADDELRRELEKRAAMLGKCLSETVREILIREVSRGSLGERLSPVRGSLRLEGSPEEPWRRRLRERNWRE
jgi:hypothetical protein